jgi:hypothetical protein
LSAADDAALSTLERLDLKTDWMYRRPTAARFGHAVGQSLNTWKAVYRWVLLQLHASDAALFQTLPDRPIAVSRRERVLFARTGEEMWSPIEVMGVHVETNYSANDIRERIVELLEIFQLALDGFTVYLRAD